MLKDRYDLELSTTSTEARDHYVELIDKMLAADGQIQQTIDAVLDADPEMALAHAAQAREHMLYGRPKEARSSAETAASFAKNASRREQQHVEIIRHLVTGQIPKSFELTLEHIQDYPRDAFVLNPASGVFGTIGFSGRVTRETDQIELLEPLKTHYGNDWWFLTVYAFALLETGQWREARKLMEQSLEQRPTNSHGAHTFVHALFESGDDAEALSYMQDWIPNAPQDSLLRCHNWWHYALLLLVNGDQAGAYKALEENCLPGTTNSPSINVLTDSVSFLWRAELSGAERNLKHWQSLLEYYDSQFRQPIVFVDAHIGLVFAALGDFERLDQCIDELTALGENNRLPAGTTAASLTKAYRAFAKQDWSGAIELFEPMMEQLVRIGGSRAQRDLQTNTLLAAYMKDGRSEQAKTFLATQHDRQPSRPVVV